jgi:quinol-cytochrome oxidoreductase complex cytochrome b subunit/mono/diheme cytochrome c family protein
MIRKLLDWLDHRTGYRKLVDAMLLEHIPGGAKWRYVWGSTLAFVFSIQLITGVLLMFHYSPGDSTAWGSVFFIQYKMEFGWLIRGLHHFGSQTMVVLLGIHMLQVVIAGAHLPPREINWWLGLALMGVVFGLSLTGYLLPWDQKGYWATQVATNIAGNLPLLGPLVQKIVVGGSEYGHHTLTHFYALHVGVLPPLLIVLLIAHIAVFRRHGITTPPGATGEGVFWPDQAFRDMVVCMLVFGVMLGLVIFGGQGHEIPTPGDRDLYDQIAYAGRDGRGADLDAPADAAAADYPARPEWYFLFLFQLLKYFEGDMEIMGTVVIPNGVLLLLFLLPLLGFGRMRKFGHLIGIIVVVALIAAVGVLTYLAMDADAKNEDFQKRDHGIPEEGGRALLRGDPATRGRELFKSNCGACHSFTSANPAFGSLADPKAAYSASDLGGFGKEKWIRDLLRNPKDDRFFGRSKHEVEVVNDDGKKVKEIQYRFGGMIAWREGVEAAREKFRKKNPAEVDAKIAEEEKAFDLIARWLADQAHPKDKRDPQLEKDGLEAFGNKIFGRACSSCHNILREDPPGKGEVALIGGLDAPSFTDYGSQEWIRTMVMSPASKLRYKKNNRMPAFRPMDGPGAEVSLHEFRDNNPDFPPLLLNRLSDFDRELIIRFMTYDHRVVFGGREISGAKKK